MMIDVNDIVAGVLAGPAIEYRLVAESWYGGEPLAVIPAESGTEEIDRTLRVPESVRIAVPRLDGRDNWDPTGDPLHPLAPNGQRLRIALELNCGGEDWERIDRGEFLITDFDVQGDTVNVTALGLLALVSEARFLAPFQPSGTFASTARALVEPALTVNIDAEVEAADRSVPAGLVWETERIDALYELLDAWPADCRVTTGGVLEIIPDEGPEDSVISLTDGDGGTVIRFTGDGSRGNAANMAVARGEAEDGSQIQAVSIDLDPASPLRYGGPFNSLAVPYFFESPLLTTAAQCRAAAATVMRRIRRKTGRTISAEAVPNFTLQVGDVATVTGGALTATPCVIEAMALPLNPGGGAMRLSMREVF